MTFSISFSIKKLLVDFKLNKTGAMCVQLNLRAKKETAVLAYQRFVRRLLEAIQFLQIYITGRRACNWFAFLVAAI